MKHIIKKATLPSYAQEYGKPFNFIEFLHKGMNEITQDEMNDAANRSRQWPMCAVGNMCSIIPRKTSGAPYDSQLDSLGCEFPFFLSSMNGAKYSDNFQGYERARLQALEIFRKIECRSSQLIDQILDAQELADKTTKQIPLI